MWVDVDAAFPQQFRQGTLRCRDHRAAASRRLDSRQPEAFDQRWKRKRGRAIEQDDELLIGKITSEDHSFGDPQLLDLMFDDAKITMEDLFLILANQDQPHVGIRGTCGKPGECGDQRFKILVWAESSDIDNRAMIVAEPERAEKRC